LNIEHGVGINGQAKGRLNMVSQSLFVALLDGRPLTAEGLIFGELEETLKFVEVLEPNALVEFQSLRDEGAQFGVALLSQDQSWKI
jgi:hypothetical protein